MNEIGKIKKGYKFGGTIVRVVGETPIGYIVTFSRYRKGGTVEYKIEVAKESVEL